MISDFYDHLRFELKRAPLTVDAYKNDIDGFCSWISPHDADNICWKEVTSADVRSWLASLARKGLSPVSLRRKTVALRTLFKWLMKSGVIEVSPLRDIPLPKIPKPLPDIIKSSEIEEALAEAASNSADGSAIALMKDLILDLFYSLGIRRAELIGIDDGDFSFNKGELKVTGKRSKQRVIPLPARLSDKIRKYMEIRDLELEKPSGEYPLFYIKGRRISAGQVYKFVHEALASSSAKKRSPHALRHSFASGMLNGGAEIDSVREFLGHSSLATTQIYTHISLKDIKKAYSLAHPRSSQDHE